MPSALYKTDYKIGEKQKSTTVHMAPVYILMVYRGVTVLHGPLLMFEPVVGSTRTK